MCGIVGALRIRPDTSEPLPRDVGDKMLQTIWRRGPDGEGQWRDSQELCWLGHRRLAIIDVVSGHQPMANEDQSVWVIFNGEIYNYADLRAELVGRGHKFKTHSDTEVLVHGYEEWGGEQLSRSLQGIFAFAIYDVRSKVLFMSRDHLGVKPFHWWTDGNTFLFASEIKSLLAHPALASRRVDTGSVAQFLISRYISRPRTMFEGIQRLPEASFMEIRVGQDQVPEPRTYWDVSYKEQSRSGSLENAVEELDRLLRKVVAMQLMSEVPLGAQLSGGVDSSIVVALMEQLRQENGSEHRVKTFSVGFDIERYSELGHARRIASRYNTEHHEIHIGFKEFVWELPLLCWLYDDPLGDPPAIPTYFMCKRAKPHVTVMLCGEGADEQFGGYNKYVFDQFTRYIDWLPAKIRKPLLRGAGALMPFSARRIRSILEILALSNKSARFASWYGALDAGVQAELLDAGVRAQYGERFMSEVYDELLARCDSPELLNQFLYCDTHTRLVEDMLVVADRMSMGASVEARVPFLDRTVVEFAAGLPPEYKVSGLRTKVLLKKLAERYAPVDLIYRRKVGFVVPLSDWFVGPLSQLLKDVLLSERCLTRGYWRPDVLIRIVNDHLQRKVDREQGIWVILALEIWHRLFVDDDGSEAAVDRVQQDLYQSLAFAAPN